MDDTCSCVDSALDLFTPPFKQSGVVDGNWIEIRPVNSTNNHGALEFKLKGSGEDFTDLAHSYIKLKVRIVKQDGSPMTNADNVGFVNLPVASLFRQVDLYLGDRLVSSSNDSYPYRAIFETLLSHNNDVIETQLSNGLFFKDDAGRMNETDIVGENVNSGYLQRFNLTQSGKAVELIGRVYSDLFNQERYLVNNIRVTLKFHPSKPEFCLLSNMENPDYKIVIDDAALFFRKVTLASFMYNQINKSLMNKNIRYPITRITHKTFSLGGNQFNPSIDNVFDGVLPSRIVIGMVRNSAYNGNYRENPFNFEHFNLSSICPYNDSKPVPARPILLDYENDLYLEGYVSLFNSMDKLFHNDTNCIKRAEYPLGYSLLGFDFTPSISSGDSFDVTRRGSMRIQFNFKRALPTTINVILYAEFQNVIEINSGRNVTTDYTI